MVWSPSRSVSLSPGRVPAACPSALVRTQRVWWHTGDASSITRRDKRRHHHVISARLCRLVPAVTSVIARLFSCISTLSCDPEIIVLCLISASLLLLQTIPSSCAQAVSFPDIFPPLLLSAFREPKLTPPNPMLVSSTSSDVF